MRKYEIMYILNQDTKEDVLSSTKEKLEKILTANGGTIEEQAEWGLIDFAYEINHKKKGYYFVLIVNTDAKNIEEFERVSKIDKNVIRQMVINTETEEEYIQSTQLSKTDVTKWDEERREKRPFRRNFNNNRSYQNNNDNDSSEPRFSRNESRTNNEEK